jgi:hypothetical protein
VTRESETARETGYKIDGLGLFLKLWDSIQQHSSYLLYFFGFLCLRWRHIVCFRVCESGELSGSLFVWINFLRVCCFVLSYASVGCCWFCALSLHGICACSSYIQCSSVLSVSLSSIVSSIQIRVLVDSFRFFFFEKEKDMHTNTHWNLHHSHPC